MQRPSENALIARYLAPLAGAGALGLRDDAGLATPRQGYDLIVTKDMLVAGVHFFADDPPDTIARKALRVNLSDLAAKGAAPMGFMLGLALPGDWTEAWVAAFVNGLEEDARVYGCPLIGGDTVSTPGPITLSVTAFGEVPAGTMVPRTGARAGDLLYVTGTIGDAALGLKLRLRADEDAAWIGMLDEPTKDTLCRRFLLPEPRLALRLALAHARAAMDVSDGFVGDLTKMLALEMLTASIDAAVVPLSGAVRAAIALEPSLLAIALTGGDDYEVICAVAFDQRTAFLRAARESCVQVTAIGVVVAGGECVRVRGTDGSALDLGMCGFDHFT